MRPIRLTKCAISYFLGGFQPELSLRRPQEAPGWNSLWCRSYHSTPCCRSASASILDLLRQRGPIPVSKISSELSDEDLEQASESGGIVELLKHRSDVVLVTLRKTVHIAVLKDLIQHVDRQQKQAVTLLLAMLAALQHFPKIFGTSRGPLVATHESLFRLAMSEGFTDRFDCADSVHRVLHRYPSLFRMERGRVRLTTVEDLPVKRVAGVIHADMPGLPAAASLSVKQEMLLKAIRSTVPESMYISLQTWMKSAASFWCSLPLEELRSRMAELQNVDPPRVDIRSFGEGLENSFIRVLGRQRDGFSVEEETRKGVLQKQKEIFSLGQRVVKILTDFHQENTENKLATMNGLTMEMVGELLPVQMKDEIISLFYDRESSSVRSKAAMILLFDRLRHVFDVNFSAGTIRLWSALPPTEQPSTLTWESTPLPLVLRHALKELSTTALAEQQLYETFPEQLRWQLHQLYGSSSAKSTDALAEVRLFVSHHSMFLFIGHDGLLYTPQLIASQSKRKKSENFTDAEKAKMIFDALPPSGAVDLLSFLGSEKGRQLPFSTRHISETFVARFPSFFKLYSPFGSHRTVVGKVGAPPPPEGLLNPSLTSVEDLVKFIALHAIGGVTESTIMNNLSKEGRMLTRRLGTLTDLASQLPMWFDVRKDKFNSGASLITYLPVAPDDPSLPQQRLQLVPNDRQENKNTSQQDQWNDDWNED